MVGLQSILHVAFAFVAASQASSGVLETCPDPVKSLLRNRSLWTFEVDYNCEEGEASWHGSSDALHYVGTWPSICADPNNASMLIYSIHQGFYEHCEMDSDCWTIPCSTKCMGNECVPMGPSCMNTTMTFMDPASFEAACPADPRDMTCMEMKDSWDEAGCHIFDEMPEDAPPPNAEFASQCLPYLTRYEACVEELFEGSYLEHRLSPVHEISEFLTSFMAPRCVKVDPALAKALNGIPCTQP
mmetsp:Transcript_53366/g.149857  ORF Transcript_53366/g.149857 Transcript_53366/m.149857 type:complete len:243 (+) Transcript_53366:71-799(+)